MKLRFRGNSLRLRVNQREVQALASGAAIREEITFPGDAQFAYMLEPHSQTAPVASFEHGIIRVAAPLDQVKNWAKGEAIGIYFDLAANGTLLKVAIEKDLECIDDPVEERDPDAFPRKNCPA